jgi:chromosome partitioning protein
MSTIAVVHKKGGSAKTTTVVSLAACFAEAGLRALVVDLDPQAHATRWLGASPAGAGEPSLLHVLVDGDSPAALIRDCRVPGIEVLPASSNLIKADVALTGEVAPETLLRAALDRLPDPRDIVLLDCPGTMGMTALMALTAATEVLIPLDMSYFALADIPAICRTAEKVRTRINPRLDVIRILACRVDPITRLSRDIVRALRDAYPDLMLHTVIPESVRVREAPGRVMPITQYDPTGKVAAAYRAAAAEITARST